MTAALRFRIARATWVRPLLLIFGATDARSFVELRPDLLYARFGWYRIEIPRASIQSAARARWPWYAGLGWRTNLHSTIGLIGSYDDVVKLSIDPPQPTRLLLIPMQLKELYLSLENASELLATLDGGA